MNRSLTEKYNPIILSGFGGIGKTELAIEFGRRIMMKSRDRNVYFVRFQESFRKTIVGPIAEAFSGYSKFDENNKLKSEDLIFEEVIKLLGELNSDDILIIDNVDDAKKGFHELRAGDDHGKSLNTLLGCLNVILTTRDNQSDSVEIMEMNEEELILLTQKLGLRCERERLLPLISLVNNHTLTVELCARTLIHTPNLTPEALYNILLEGEYSSIELKQVDTLKDREYEHARIEVHLRKLFQIAELDMEEQKVLSNALLLPVRGIERELFMKALLLTDSKKIEHLIERGWIKHDKANDIVLVHPLINSICRKTEEISPTIERCKTYIWWVDSWIRKASKSLLKTPYEQVAQCAYAYFEKMVEFAENQILMNSLGYYYFLSGDYEKSKEYYKGALEKSYQYHHLDVFVEVSIRYSRTLEISRQGNDEGIRILENFEKNSVLKEYLSHHPEKQVDVLATYATLLRVDNRQKEAIEKCEQALNIVKKNPDNTFNPVYIAHSYYELSVCKYELRETKIQYLEEAEKDAKEALKRHIECYGKECVEQANDYNALGDIYIEKGRIQEAVLCFQKSYEIRLEHYGEKNLYTTNSLEGYALALSYDFNRREEAESSFLKALKNKKDILPIDNEWIGDTYQKITQFYLRGGQWKKAVLYGKEGLKILRKNKYKVGRLLYDLAEALFKLGEKKQAKYHVEQAIYFFENQKDEQHNLERAQILLRKIDDME